jgi:RHS repeat-associated protein
LTLRQERIADPDSLGQNHYSGRNLLAAFSLTANDAQNREVQQFDNPVTLSYTYTDEELAALGISPYDLTLFWLDESRDIWVPQATTLDYPNKTVSAQVNHFSEYGFGDGQSPSDSYIPSLQGFQTSLYTGSASYSVPIEVPAGPGGIKPSLSLSYSSAATDGDSGKREKQQAGWAGKGWSLDTGYIARHKQVYTDYGSNFPYFSLVLNGQSFTLIRGNELVSGALDYELDKWEWYSSNEEFLRFKVVALSPETNRGGTFNGNPVQRYGWHIWTKDGTRHEFEEDLWWGWQCEYGSPTLETYKWMLSRTVDVHDNVISYDYERDSKTDIGARDCNNGGPAINGVVDRDAWLTGIAWGHNLSASSSNTYYLEFKSSQRTLIDVVPEHPSGDDPQYGGPEGRPRETRQLDQIILQIIWQGDPDPIFETVRGYQLLYTHNDDDDDTPNLYPDIPGHTSDEKRGLVSIQEFADDGDNDPNTALLLPKTSFRYGANDTIGIGAGYTAGYANRLISVDNGQGGTLSITYDNLAVALLQVGEMDVNPFFNTHRVTRKTYSDGRGNYYANTYDYQSPNYNALGQDGFDYKGLGVFPNSATLYYAANIDASSAQRTENIKQLNTAPTKEFRGHAVVTETVYLSPTIPLAPLVPLSKTQHEFIQGDVTCTLAPDYPAFSTRHEAIISNSCFLQLRDQELLKGKEWRTRTLDVMTNLVLQEVEHGYGVDFYAYAYRATHRIFGVWHAFTFPHYTHTRYNENDVIDDGSVVPLGKSVFYFYREDQQSDHQRGNRTHTVEYDQLVSSSAINKDCLDATSSIKPYRCTRLDYITLETSDDYIVDRVAQQAIFNGNGQLLALTENFYDSSTAYKGFGTRGNLTLSRVYTDIPLHIPPQSGTLHSNDTSYTYDVYGNPLTQTSYTAQGTRTHDTLTGTTAYSSAGNGSTERTKTTTYDSTFHAFPIRTDLPAVGSLVLSEEADYDFRLGRLISATDYNGNESRAEYDPFGRMIAIYQPDDTTTPSLEFIYDDVYRPVRYQIKMRYDGENSRIATQFYDGLGRLIQTKQQLSSTHDIVVDNRYDGLDRQIASSQPRSIATDINTYTAPGSTLHNATLTSYDWLSRPLSVIVPDGSETKYHYGIAQNMRFTDVMDANCHRIQHRNDVFDRLKATVEISGPLTLDGSNCPSQTSQGYGFDTYATTTYSYTALDKLSQVTDNQANTTAMAYDSIGRKTSMSDPDMGAWSYSYDPAGSIVSQTDAKGQVTSYTYDAINRLTSISAGGSTFATYGYDAGTNGKGQRTSMSRDGSTISWAYDSLGRKTSETYSITGLSGTRSIGWSYFKDGRVQTLTYPSSEVVTYSYDLAGHQTSLCSSLGGCYASSATYTALDQPISVSFGNGLVQNWTYSGALQRLSKLKVGTSGVLERDYEYDKVGNLSKITDAVAAQQQQFEYDHRDRLTKAWTSATMAAAPSLSPLDLALVEDPGASSHAAVGSAKLQFKPAFDVMNLLGSDLQQQASATNTTQNENPAPLSAPSDGAQTQVSTDQAASIIGDLPLLFVRNEGQEQAPVLFSANTLGGTVFFTPQGPVFDLPEDRSAWKQAHTPDEKTKRLLPTTIRKHAIRLTYHGANPAPVVEGTEALTATVNYLNGTDSAKWQTGIDTFGSLVYRDLYQGIDLHFEGNEGSLKGTYIVDPGVDPSQIVWSYAGARAAEIDPKTGDLVVSLRTKNGRSTADTLEIREHAPIAWQIINGQKHDVAVRFTVDRQGQVRFTLGNYDRTHELIIDPTVTYSSYIGGSSADTITTIAVDASGAIYIGGQTFSSNYPTVTGSYDTTLNTGVTTNDGFVTKISSAGNTLVYSTYIGGSNNEAISSIKLDASGNLYVAGWTASNDFPQVSVTSSYGGGNDGFLLKLNASGSALLYSRYIGGNQNDNLADIELLADGTIYFAGNTASTNLSVTNTLKLDPLTTAPVYQSSNAGGVDGMAGSLNSTGAIRYLTYIGGNFDETITEIALDSDQRVVIGGYTNSTNLPSRELGLQQSYSGGVDGFVVRLNRTASALDYSSYVGGVGADTVQSVAVDTDNGIILAGYTGATSGFPLKNAFQNTLGGSEDMFVMRLTPTGDDYIYSTYYGGTGSDGAKDIAVWEDGSVVVSGQSPSTFTIPNSRYPVQATNAGGKDVIVLALDPTGQPIYSTFYGGNAEDDPWAMTRDATDAIYIAGRTLSTNFPIHGSAYASSLASTNYDGFVFKLRDPRLSDCPANRIYTVKSSQTTFIEAEAYTHKQGNINTVHNTGRSNQIYMQVVDAAGANDNPAQHYMRYDLNVETTGNYYIHVLGSGSDGDGDSMYISVDSGSNYQIDMPVLPNWTWKQNTLNSAINLTAGKHSLYLRVRQDGVAMDKIAISTSATAPTGLGGEAASSSCAEVEASLPEAFSYNETYQYDSIGNITNKAGVSYSYGSSKPHAVTLVSDDANLVLDKRYSYDANGNMLSGDGRTYTWTSDNLPRTISSAAGGERFLYNADGQRIARIFKGVTTYYFGGLWELDSTGESRAFYAFGGQAVAQRTINGSSNVVLYLHGDHLGSIGVTTNSSGAVVSRQYYDAWGAVRSGNVTQTTRNYTGQIRDDSGLLYYNARMYDPVLARFVSADTVVPGTASGSMDGIALKPLTVAFHETGFIGQIASENNQPFWFQMSGKQKQQAGWQWGPRNPQSLNRYSYVLNNPIKYTDPSGHSVYLTNKQAREFAGAMAQASLILGAVSATGEVATTGIGEVIRRILALANGISGEGQIIFKEIVQRVALGFERLAAAGILATGVGLAFIGSVAYSFNSISNLINTMNGSKGVGLATVGGSLWVLDREAGDVKSWTPGTSPGAHYVFNSFPDYFKFGQRPVGDRRWMYDFHFKQDSRWIPEKVS